jgi:hypothetical protein
VTAATTLCHLPRLAKESLQCSTASGSGLGERIIIIIIIITTTTAIIRSLGRTTTTARQRSLTATTTTTTTTTTDSFGVRNDPWHLTEALELGLHPRPFDELHAERAYLLNALQSHDQQTLELFRRLPTLEEQISLRHEEVYQRRRQDAKVKVKVNGIQARGEEEEDEEEELGKACRQRVWLRRQIEDTLDAERGLLMRLSELHVEIQCHERWCQVERERAETMMMMRVGPEAGYEGLGYTHDPCCYYPEQNALVQLDMHVYQPRSDG